MTAGGTTRDDDVWIGLDLGTQSVRALAVTADGTVAGSGSGKLTSHRDGPAHEQDPAQWWEQVVVATRAALQGISPERVRGVAVDATSGTIVLTDPDGRPLTPGIMYDDTRGAAEVDEINAVGAEVWATLGYQRMQPSWALPSLRWLLRQHPELVGTARLAHQSDVITGRLVGRPVAADLSNALKTGANLDDETWPLDVFERLGIPATLLPPLVRTGAFLGEVGSGAAAETGIPVGTPVIAGATDGCAAQLGAGALRIGSWNSVVGTTLVLKGVSHELIRDPLGVVYSHKAPNGDWLPGGASSTGAGAVSRDFPGADLDELGRRAAAFAPTDVLAYPLVSDGERFPFIAPDARGFLLGDPRDDAEHFAAVLQGVAFVERLCFDYLDLLGAPIGGDLIVTGGATRSPFWNQLRADVLGRPLVLPENAEGALGMAVLAASPGREAADVAAEMVRIRATVDPRPEMLGRYDDAYLRLVGELEGRGWLPASVATLARERTGTGR
ncbi:FGGY-family carbohydrate kinase [Nakamurella flavida]|uniref:FGGY-family carbohydrate kinase n=1 Tax=Nakamurella flavida TaxID=363630 RepID=A0A939C6K7_9ACTN|nr:FGGY-family carbohydrate kinase [Nakamurella flavida]MBM9478199.1 FGGY-family carbohydrate kinase [Nakamurella flavida]MDP9778579.1 sugar (pentulose or hexulose) kinase [Nakamurella flavida]